MSKGIKLYVDDIREAPEGWTLVRTVTEAVKFIEMYGEEITHISLDHDISYPVEVNGLKRPYPSPECFCTVARYIRERYGFLALLVRDFGKDPKEALNITLHTANPDGAGTMKFILKDFKPIYEPAKAVNRLEEKRSD